jgi:hypothetical protein
MGRSGWRGGANASPCHRVAQSSRPGSAEKPGGCASKDFMHDVLIDGRRFQTLNTLDLALEVDPS